MIAELNEVWAIECEGRVGGHELLPQDSQVAVVMEKYVNLVKVVGWDQP